MWKKETKKFVIDSCDYMHISTQHMSMFDKSSFAASSNLTLCLLIIHLSRHGIPSAFCFFYCVCVDISSFFLIILRFCLYIVRLNCGYTILLECIQREYVVVVFFHHHRITRRLIYRKWLDQFYFCKPELAFHLDWKIIYCEQYMVCVGVLELLK